MHHEDTCYAIDDYTVHPLTYFDVTTMSTYEEGLLSERQNGSQGTSAMMERDLSVPAQWFLRTSLMVFLI